MTLSTFGIALLLILLFVLGMGSIFIALEAVHHQLKKRGLL